MILLYFDVLSLLICYSGTVYCTGRLLNISSGKKKAFAF